jgi:hypothetical protein
LIFFVIQKSKRETNEFIASDSENEIQNFNEDSNDEPSTVSNSKSSKKEKSKRKRLKESESSDNNEDSSHALMFFQKTNFLAQNMEERNEMPEKVNILIFN